MRVLHDERQHQLIHQAQRLGQHLDLRPSDGGLHLIGRLLSDHADTIVAKDALRQGVHVWPLSIHYCGPNRTGGLLLGYAGTTPTDMRSGVEVFDDVLASR
jgi:GntR family transcriptional regulator / MocR family aminotransferase